MPRLQERPVGRLSKTALRWKYLRLFGILSVLKYVQRKEGIDEARRYLRITRKRCGSPSGLQSLSEALCWALKIG
jgi:hypothetical protein